MTKPLVGIIMGSQSDWPTMREAADVLDELGVAYETKIVSATARLIACGNTERRPLIVVCRSSLLVRAGPRIYPE
jgi:hypothetical protein